MVEGWSEYRRLILRNGNYTRTEYQKLLSRMTEIDEQRTKSSARQGAGESPEKETAPKPVVSKPPQLERKRPLGRKK